MATESTCMNLDDGWMIQELKGMTRGNRIYWLAHKHPRMKNYNGRGYSDIGRQGPDNPWICVVCKEEAPTAGLGFIEMLKWVSKGELENG